MGRISCGDYVGSRGDRDRRRRRRRRGKRNVGYIGGRGSSWKMRRDGRYLGQWDLHRAITPTGVGPLLDAKIG
jgi:hypothetical protein